MRLKRPEINIIPFVDIMLVLLAITLVLSSFIAEGKIKVNLQNAQSSKQAQNNKQNIKITISKENRFFLDNKELSLSELEIKIAQLEKSNEITIHGDKESDFGYFVTIIDLLKNQNLENVHIAVMSDEPTK